MHKNPNTTNPSWATSSADQKSALAASVSLTHQAIADRLIAETIGIELGQGAMLDALRAGPETALSHLRNLASAEGRIIEQMIRALASSAPDNLVLRGGICLPVAEAALELASRNRPEALSPISLSSDHSTRRGYTPDLIIGDQRTHAALVIEIKRTITSYDAARLETLKERMLAASLTLPDHLYREQMRLHVSSVEVAILAADNRKTDTTAGIWSLNLLDDLIGVAGAAFAVDYLKTRLNEMTNQAWRDALAALSAARCDQPAFVPASIETLGTFVDDVFVPAVSSDRTPLPPVRFGLAQSRLNTAH